MKQLNLIGGSVKTQADKRAEKHFIEKMMYFIKAPLVIHPMGWGSDIPEHLRQRILIERLINSKTDSNLATETETLWYISSCSLVAPLDHSWYNIMMYLTRRFLIATKKELPDFLKENIVLDEYIEERDLYDLREWIFRKQMDKIKGDLKANAESN